MYSWSSREETGALPASSLIGQGYAADRTRALLFQHRRALYGRNPADPFQAAAGASGSDTWINANVTYAHSSADRNTVRTGTISDLQATQVVLGPEGRAGLSRRVA